MDAKGVEELTKASYAAGRDDGSFEEAKEALRRRFTDRELEVFINLCWKSPQMQSIRNRLFALEAAVILPDIENTTNKK